MKYKVGDKVKIKSLDWYNTNKDSMGFVYGGFHLFDEKMSHFCGQVMTIQSITNLGVISIEGDNHYWTDEMIECLVEPAPVMINLDKACKWLRRNYTNYMINDLSKYVEDVCSFDIFDDSLVDDFRKAMEE